jgi:hypothetical protein
MLNKIENSVNALRGMTPAGIAPPGIRIRWKPSSMLWGGIICAATVGLLGCITAIVFAAAAPALVPGLVAFVYIFYRLALGCFLTALLAPFFLIFSINWVSDK